jgi:lipid-A-disaccharide synthase
MATENQSLWFVAGETSGDARAAEVMSSLRELAPELRFQGAGGPRMQALAAEPFDNWIAEAGVLGFWDVLKHYGYFRKKFRTMLEDIIRLRPKAVVLVDYPGFNLRLAKALRARRYGGKVIQFISPQVWAWNRRRIPAMARSLDLMLCVFPFEKPLYEASGLSTVFTGHPLLEALAREKSGVPRDPSLFALLPGSRVREVKRIFPAMVEAARRIQSVRPDIRFEAVAASEAQADRLYSMAQGVPITISYGSAHDLMQRARAGLVCSGTATLEAAFFSLPHAIVYRVAWHTYEIGIRVIKGVNALGIINILNNYQLHPPADPRESAGFAPVIVREFIQHGASPEALAEEGLRLLNDEEARSALTDRLQALVATLEAEGASHRAAQAILKNIRKDEL